MKPALMLSAAEAAKRLGFPSVAAFATWRCRNKNRLKSWTRNGGSKPLFFRESDIDRLWKRKAS